VYIGALDNNGTVELFAYHPLSGNSLKGVQDNGIYSTIAEGGAGTADSAQVLYSTAARTSVPIRLLGYVEVQTGGTAGIWSNAPTLVQLITGNSPQTGTILQRLFTRLSTGATGTTVIPNDDTIPQITEGDEYMTQAITPLSTVNLLNVEHVGVYSSTAAGTMTCALFQDATPDSLAAIMVGLVGAGSATVFNFSHTLRAGTISSTTFRIRTGNASAGTTTFNGFSSVRKLGGVMASQLVVTELFV
jgi:hypothetical protein